MAINQLAAALVFTVISGSVLAAAPASQLSQASQVTSAAVPVQGKTRAQVIAELEQARANGELNYNDANYPGETKFVSTKTRAQVIAELEQARAKGELNYRDADYPEPQTVASGRTRAQVIAELLAYRKMGNVPGVSELYQGY